MISSAETLKYLQQLQNLANNAVSSATSARNATKQTDDEDDYQSIFTRIQKEQEDWDAKMKELDIAQYKIQAMDSFWTGSHKYQNLAYKYALREQQNQNQQAINSLVFHISDLQRMNFADLANGNIDAKSAVELHKSLNTALQSAVMLSMMNSTVMQSMQGSNSGGFYF
ncbi:hypothetical protein [Selenomonas sp. KH1T6]|uniref:hypothetical protein n=1 Tax=Selenomonas sp. KH1T6 TaxID=3158784 RepID=UPI0008A77647|nr:hypothetical protein SAMN05216583_10893 [Selenomonas ruminantium]